jgi:hypothetical protein
MTELLLVWIGLLAICLWLTTRRQGVGVLLLAYFLALSLVHVPGAINFLGSAPGLTDKEVTQIGFQATVMGFAALLLGAGLGMAGHDTRTAVGTARTDYGVLGRQTLGIGGASFFVLLPVASLVPSLTSLLSAVASLLIVGFWMLIFHAIVREDRKLLLLVLSILPVLPLLTLSTGGFVANSTNWIIAILSFLFVNSKKRIVYYCVGPFFGFLALSLAVSYLEGRNAIREAAWSQNAGYGERIGRIVDTVASFKFYDWNDRVQVRYVDIRMNQNYFVGLGIERHERGQIDLLYGGSVEWWAFIPRAVWPDKPDVGGGGDLITRLTGFRVAKGVSYGVGQPLEFYANFGWFGLIGGFVLLGFVLARLDQRLARAFRTGDLRGILLAGLPGIALLEPIDNALEISVGLAAAFVVAHLLAKAAKSFGIVDGLRSPAVAGGLSAKRLHPQRMSMH